MRFLFFALLISNISVAQNSRVVLDKRTHSPIPYATIKVLNTKFGAIANEKGVFQLSLVKEDSLLISSVGYQTRRIPALEFDSIIFLEAKPEVHKEVVIRTKKIIRIVEVGEIQKASDPDYNWAPTFKLNEEFGKEFSLPDSNLLYKVKRVLFPIQKTGNCFSPIFLHFYLIDTINNLPGEEIYLLPVTVSKSNFKKDILTIDLSNENILIGNSKKFVVSFSWVPDSFNNYCFSTFPFLLTDNPGKDYTRYLEDVSYQWRPFGNMKHKDGRDFFISLNVSVELEELK